MVNLALSWRRTLAPESKLQATLATYKQTVRLVVQFLTATGMRRGEVAAVRCDDLDLDQSLLRVMGKGGRERLVPLGRK